jgi:hypothetical protein
VRGRDGRVRHSGQPLIITPFFQVYFHTQKHAFASQLGPGVFKYDALRKVGLGTARLLKLLPVTGHVQKRAFASELSPGTFKYNPLRKGGLPRTRILELLPGTEEDPIQCNLKEIGLSTASSTKFESLSYTWGSPNDKTSMICNGMLLDVPANLGEALEALRFSDRSRMLWADAVCINQLDDEEKGQQVQLMRTIYSSAERTLIWLGHRNDRHEQGISKAATLSLEIGLWILQKSIKAKDCPTISVWNSKRNQTRILLPFSGEFYIALISMLKRPWFQRAWVVQEVVVSKKVTIVWDHAEYDWDELVSVIRFMTMQHFPPSFLFSLQHVAAIEDERCTYRNGSVSLLGVLLRHQRCHATDPRDKVYSFSGLIDGVGTRASVSVSYKESAAKLYKDLARQLMQDTKSLDILSRPPSISPSGVEKLPSWVPNWSVCTSMNASHTWSHGPLSLSGADTTTKTGKPPFNATNGTDFALELDDPDTLVLSGFVFDTIIEAGPSFKGLSLPQTVSTVPDVARDWMKTKESFLLARTFMIQWQEMLSLSSNPNSNYVGTDETLSEAFWQTVSAGELNDSEQVAKSVKLWKSMTWFPYLKIKHIPASFKMLGLPYCLFLLTWHLVTNKPLLEFELQGRYTLHRRMVKTEKGYIGLASSAAIAGDSIILCKGSKVPLVFRPAESSQGSKWVFVGDAYVHGIMQGQAFDEDMCKEMKLV